jgi:putative tryptophan/tyrosine transport system substrate-binding protein
MRRRDLVVRLGGAVLAWPFAVSAQPAAIPVIGFLDTGNPNDRVQLVEAFRQGLREGGYVDGRGVAIEYRWAEGHYDRLPQLASELVNRKVALIVAIGGMESAVAARSATSAIPIVFSGGGDPVKLGLVASLSHPGGNVTGLAGISRSLTSKRLEILRDVLPAATVYAYLANPNAADASSAIKEVQAAAAALHATVQVLRASSVSEIDAAFNTVARSRANALLVATDPFFTTNRDQIIALAARHAIPASYAFREFVVAGGLMSYGSNLADSYRQTGVYAARVLKGAKPSDLPVIQATKLELVLNLTTAKKLGLSISRDFLSRVDEVIE